MFKFAFASMRSSIGRLIAAGIAIMLGTGFVTATLLSTDVVRATAEAAVSADLAGADIIVDPSFDSKVDLDAIAALPGVKGVDHQVSEALPLRGYGGTRFVELRSLPVHGPAPDLASGTAPSARDEIAISQDLAEALRVGVGDLVDWDSYYSDVTGSLKISGITQRQASLLFNSAPAWTTPETILALQEQRGGAEFASPGRLLVYTDDQADLTTLLSSVERSGTDLYVTIAREAIDRQVEHLTGNAQFFVVFGLAFAAVAVIVAAMVIANTFEVLVAQRARLLALLRCGGATKGQVASSVLVEAVLLGLISSVVGVALGLGLGQAAAWFLSQRSFGVTTSALQDISPITFLVPIVVGVTVTLLAALGPARAATRVSPVTALRPLSADPIRGGGRARFWVGLTTLVVGLVLLLGPPIGIRAVFLLDSFEDLRNDAPSELMPLLLLVGILGGLLTVGGFLILSVYIVPRVVKLFGGLVAAVLPKEAAATARLATANAIRNPRRTAATTSALVIGVGLVVMMGTGAATARATMAQSLGSQFPADVVILASTPDGLVPETMHAVERTEGVIRATEVWAQSVTLASEHNFAEPVMVGNPAQLNATLDGRDFSIKPGHVGVAAWATKRMENPSELHLEVVDEEGRVIEEKALPVQVIDRLPLPMILDPSNFESDLGAPSVLLVDVDDAKGLGVVSDLQRDVSEAGGEFPPMVEAPLEVRAQFDQVINALLTVMIGLLGVAVVIALVGVANTLSLSVIERRREHGMLRAVGVTQPQLRHLLSVEGVLIAMAGTLVGIALGLLCGIAGSTILLGAAPDFVLGVDLRIILGCVVVALIAGLLASVLPARNAVRVPVVVALATN